MPHSSGGGSHGGGYHSSHSSHNSHSRHSNHSSHRSHNSYGGYNRTTPPPRIYAHNHFGASRYVYYTNRGICRSLYVDGTPLSASNQLSRTFLFTVLALIFTAIIIVSVYSTGTLKVPHAIIMPSNTTIEVDDNVGILPDTVELNSVLKQFQTTTGVTPSIELVKESTWKGKYRNLEKYALNQYLYKYNDEKHWLVVISYPDNYESLEFIDWRWEGIIGDDCSTAIDAQSEELFTKTMQKYLIRSTPEELAVSLTKAYEEYIPIAMQPRISPISVTIVICAILICIVIVIIQLNKYKNSKLIEKSKKVTGTAKEYNCEYCGRMYISGTVTVCPGCGAPIPAHEESI